MNAVMDAGHNGSGQPWGRRQFVTTHWSLILAAREPGPAGAAALEEICRAYWPPLFVYARRDGLSEHDAQDAVQGFIGRLLERQDLNGVVPELGRFRGFLLSAFRNYLVSRARGETSQKRGGAAALFSLQDESHPVDWEKELSDGMTPERAFDRAWARHILARALERLKAEHRSPQQARVFEALQPALMDGGRVQGEAEVAERLGMSAGAVAVAATRLRKRYRALIEDEVAGTLADPADVQTEMRALWEAWA